MSLDATKAIRLAKFGRIELNRLSDRMGSGQGAIEKDFVISVFALLLSFHKEFSRISSQLVLKGGTAIKKVYFPDEMRFSEDLDFDAVTFQTMVDLMRRTRKLIDQDLGITNITEVRQQFKSEKVLDFQIGYTSILGQPNHITVNMNLSKARRNPNFMEVDVSPYFPNLRPSLKVMSLEEILSEKVRALLQRTQPRDVFDVWFLIKRKKLRIDPALLTYKLRLSYEAAPKNKKSSARRYSANEVIEKMRGISDMAWKRELGGLVLRRSSPQDEVVNDVAIIIRRIGDITL